MDGNVDVLVIGAGISGLAFASTYLSVHPAAALLIVEREEVLGGTWNRRRLYDHFYTQFSVGFGEFANYRMKAPPEQDQFWGLFKAKHTSSYLEEYADCQILLGKPLRHRIQFSSLVISAQKQGEIWDVNVQDLKSSKQRKIIASKVVVASGLTSIPRQPHLEGSDAFEGRIVHNVDFGSSNVLTDSAIRHVTVLGGGKSGADMVYACAKAGKKVAWIVRPNGTGPCTFVDANGKAGYNNAFELASTRAVEALQPCCYAEKSWWTNFIHRSWLGQFLSEKLWAGAHAEAIASANYINRPSLGDFGKLIPHSPLFWRNNAAGIVNHEDFYEVIAGLVDSYYDELSSLRGKYVHLQSGRSIHTDALLLGTGWQDSLNYFTPILRANLGLPYPLSAETQLHPDQIEASRKWEQRERKADADVVSEFPILANPPKHVRTPIVNAPYRLYNLVVPVDDPTRSLAVIGMLETTNYFRTAEAQSLWVTAYFDGKLGLPPLKKRVDDVAYFVAWCRRRYLSSGNNANSVNFDTLRYTDRLLAQLGLTSHLKSGWAYLFSPNKAQDYARLGQEYKERYGEDANVAKPV